MLQRAASSACSWWWASHIRTKQSKWLEQSMQDMEEKVQGMLKLIEEDGDSFAKRAEMYYKRRPELISSVEETYRAFKALADRYDLLSKELQNANRTIATVFPEQVQFDMEDDDDCPTPTPKFPLKAKNSPENKANIPKVPKAPMDSIRGFINTASKQFQPKKSASTSHARGKVVAKSGLNKDEAVKEIDKVHKEILGLQTLKEYVKSSYESGLAKYWEIENKIMEMQEKVCKLQDEYEVEIVIEDNEARNLMAEAALKSCQETLAALQVKQEKSNRETKEEFKKIDAAREILETFKRDCMKQEDTEDAKVTEDDESDEEVGGLIKELKDLDPLQKKPEKSLDTNSRAVLTVTELAEKIDELVNKVISLETAVSTQTVLINTLRTEADELHAQVKKLEDEKESLMGNTHNLSIRVKEMEDKLNRIQKLNKNVESQNNNLETNFAEARSTLDHLSQKLTSVKPDEEVEQSRSTSESKMREEVKESSSESKSKKKKDKESKSKKKKDKKEDSSPSEGKLQETEEQKDVESVDESKRSLSSSQNDVPSVDESKTSLSSSQKDIPSVDESKTSSSSSTKDVPGVDESKTSLSSSLAEEKEQVKEVDVIVQHSEPSVPKQDESDKPIERSGTFSDKKAKEDVAVADAAPAEDQSNEPMKSKAETEKEGEMSWQQMLLSGAEDREKILLKEYTTILRNYKDVKRKLSDTEKKDRDIQFDVTLQMRDLKQAILKRDQEIQNLRNQLNSLQGNKDSAEESGGGVPSNSSEEQSVKPTQDLEVNVDPVEVKEEDDFKSLFEDKPAPVSAVEEKLRGELDAILDENLDFWLRFSTSFHQVQKFKSEVHDLQDEISKLKDKKRQEGSNFQQIKSEARPIYKHLREIQTELTVWLDQSVRLKEELKRRFTSLCKIQEEITTALKEGVEEEEIKFSSHQAAKLQGEILNMKQENNKVREELQACLDHVSVLQLNVEKTLRQLNAEFGIGDQPQLQHSMSRSRVPLRSFIFGTKEKKHKTSLFSFMHPNRKYHVVRPLPPC